MTGPVTAVFAQGDGKIIAYIEELPETYAEGATIGEHNHGPAQLRTLRADDISRGDLEVRPGLRTMDT